MSGRKEIRSPKPILSQVEFPPASQARVRSYWGHTLWLAGFFSDRITQTPSPMGGAMKVNKSDGAEVPTRW